MAFYELTATQLQTAPTVFSEYWDSCVVFWNNNLPSGVYYKYCVVVESTIDSGVYEDFITYGYNTIDNNSAMVSKSKAIDYFIGSPVKVKVCASDNYNISGSELAEYARTLQGVNFTYYKTPTMTCNIEQGDIINVDQEIYFTYNSEKTTEYVKIKLYYYDVGTQKRTDLVDEYVRSNISSGQTTIVPNFSLQNYKNYAFVVEIKEINGCFGSTDYYPLWFFTGETQFYDNLEVINATRLLYPDSTNGVVELDNQIELELINPNLQEISLYSGILKYDDSYSYHEQQGEYVGDYVNERAYLSAGATKYNYTILQDMYEYYDVENELYNISVFGTTAGRRIEESVVYQKMSDASVSFNTIPFKFNINSEIGVINYTLKKLLLNNNNKYNFHVDFSAESNSIIDYAEFSLYNTELGIVATSPKIYNDTNDDSNLSLNYEFDFTNIDNNLRFYLIVNVTTTYGCSVKNRYYTFNQFVVEKFINDINIKKVEYINGIANYTYRVYIDCEEHMATIGLVLNTADSSSYLVYQKRQDPHQYIDFVISKSNATFNQQNVPYYLQIGAKENGTMVGSDFDTIRQNSEKTVVYYLLPPSLSINIDEGDIIANSNYTFLVNYYNTEEPIDYAVFTLYDKNGNIVEESPKIFEISDPPLIVYHTFKGMLDDTEYKIGVYVKTLHGLEKTIDPIGFYIDYEESVLKAPIVIDNKCNEGYINISTDIFKGDDGEFNPNPMEYIRESGNRKFSANMVKSDPIIDYGSETSSWVYWGNHININKDFVLKYWFTVGTINNNIIRLYDDNANYINIKFNRNGSNGDYVEVSGSNGLIANSNIVTDMTNSVNRYFLWIKVVDDQWDVRLKADLVEQLVFDWNESDNNLQYNMTSDLTWLNENYEDVLRTENLVANTSGFTKVLLGNAICRDLEITNNTTLDYSETIDIWDINTVIQCDFNNNLFYGDLKGDITKVRIKRKDETTNTWVTIYDKELPEGEFFHLDFKDFAVPKGIEQTYALLPLMPNGDEGEYITDTVTPNWNAIFVSDGEKCFKLYSSVSYGSIPRNVPVGTLAPIGGTYPIVIQNSKNNYRSGMLSGMLLGYNFENTRVVDRLDVVKQTQDYIDFLVNGKTKIITDWNGNCWIVKVTDSPTIDYNIANTNGISTVKFSWVEQGKYNNEEDLKRNNLTT